MFNFEARSSIKIWARATAGAVRGETSLSSARIQAIVTPDDAPFGERRMKAGHQKLAYTPKSYRFALCVFMPACACSELRLRESVRANGAFDLRLPKA